MIRRIGFPCVMFSQKRSTNHTFRLSSLNEEKLASTIERNLDDMVEILEWMDGHSMRLFRIGSSLVPFASHPQMDLDWVSMVEKRLRSIGSKYAEKGFRFSLHPGQFNVLNSERPDVVEHTMAELDYSARVLDLMGLDSSHKIILHGGCRCGDIEASTERLVEAIGDLPVHIKRRLVLENDERIFSLDHILTACETVHTPAVFDIHHHNIFPSDDLPSLLQRVQDTWKKEDGRPKLHISSQRPDSRSGTHDPMVFQKDVECLCQVVDFDFDLMVEAKAKEIATMKVIEYAKQCDCITIPEENSV